MQGDFQIIYSTDENTGNTIHWLWESEAKAMQAAEIAVGIVPDIERKELMYRGSSNKVHEHYKKDTRFINVYRHFIDYLRMSHYLPFIYDLSITTFFADELNEGIIDQIRERGWEKAFIKKDAKSLEFVDDGKSIWPDTSFDEMRKLYDENSIEGKYAIRKYIQKELFENEERYWVLNGNIYHRYNLVPKIVKEAARRLNKLGSRYYTIDATPEFVVEVNPGESSDRHGVNSAELFASWIKKEFAT